MKSFDPKSISKTLKTKYGSYKIASLSKLKEKGFGNADKLPFSIKVLLESALRNCDNYQVTATDIKNILSWKPKMAKAKEIAYKPGRVILQDFTGVPCVVDLAAMRSAMKNLGGNIKKINPQVQCDLIIDHSLQIDAFGTKSAMGKNVSLEFKRNNERYEFLKWGQNTFKNFSVIPPATGIIHQINLEYLAKGVLKKKDGKETWAYPDSLVGTDSHTTMINGIGVVGWGVGGIEAEAVMLGEPIYMLLPEVVGFELKGKLREGITATDLVLLIVQMLRQKGVVGKFVEFYGEGVKHLTLPDRATISNMGPEYGATIGIFPVDQETLNYYKLTGRSAAEIALVEAYYKEQGMFYTDKTKPAKYSDTLSLDLSKVDFALAGPKRPQDRIILSKMKETFISDLEKSVKERGFGLQKSELNSTAQCGKETLQHGAVVLASITSCTNTSNPSVLIGAGLVAKKAAELGLDVKPYVKTSFAPGSQVVEDYLTEAGLLKYLEKLKFNIVGYGCATCIGNSGPLPENVVAAIDKGNLVAASVLSGNRNFEGRISPHTKANYLASPALVVAYAIAGRVDIDFATDPIGKDKKGNDIFLKDIWPTSAEINTLIGKCVKASAYKKRYKNISKNNATWNKIKSITSDIYKWHKKSTYIQEPPFFTGITKETGKIENIENARTLVKVGDSVTTDHISPAGNIAVDSPAGKYLINEGVKPENFNSYGSRRGNDLVMTRGTFANIRLRNQIAPGTEGSWTIHFPSQKKMSIYDASVLYKKDNTPLVVIAGKEYGTGSSRDWAAKGPALLGIRVALAESYERIHRSNLAGMGILPLEFKAGVTADTLNLTGEETFNFEGINEKLKPLQDITVTAASPDGNMKTFKATVRLDTPVEIDYFRNGGILQTVLRKLA